MGSGEYDDYHTYGVCCLHKDCCKCWDQCTGKGHPIRDHQVPRGGVEV
jgi:hypothetical protein